MIKNHVKKYGKKYGKKQFVNQMFFTVKSLRNANVFSSDKIM